MTQCNSDSVFNVLEFTHFFNFLKKKAKLDKKARSKFLKSKRAYHKNIEQALEKCAVDGEVAKARRIKDIYLKKKNGIYYERDVEGRLYGIVEPPNSVDESRKRYSSLECFHPDFSAMIIGLADYYGVSPISMSGFILSVFMDAFHDKLCVIWESSLSGENKTGFLSFSFEVEMSVAFCNTMNYMHERRKLDFSEGLFSQYQKMRVKKCKRKLENNIFELSYMPPDDKLGRLNFDSNVLKVPFVSTGERDLEYSDCRNYVLAKKAFDEMSKKILYMTSAIKGGVLLQFTSDGSALLEQLIEERSTPWTLREIVVIATLLELVFHYFSERKRKDFTLLEVRQESVASAVVFLNKLNELSEKEKKRIEILLKKEG